MTEEMTLDEFKRAMKRKEIYYIVMFVLGLATCVLFSTAYANNQMQISDLIKGLYTGMGGGIAGATLILLIRSRKIRRDEKRLKEKKINDLDERNIKIQGKAKELSFHIMFISLYIGVVVAGIFDSTVSMVLSGYIIFFGILNSVLVMIFQRKM
jgi:hypothetical protein